MSEEEPKYTLQEARRIIRREECRVNGHDLDQVHLRNGTGRIVSTQVNCTHCGTRFIEETNGG